MSTSAFPLTFRGLPPLTTATLTIYGSGVLLLLTSLLTWEPGKNPRVVIGLLAVTAAVLFVHTWWRGARFSRAEALALVAVQFTIIAAMTWTTDLVLGAYANGTVLPILAVYVVWFLHPVWGRVVLWAGLVAWLAAVVHHRDSSLTGFATTLPIQAIAASEVFAQIKSRMERLARTDSLTRTLNRGSIRELAERELSRSVRSGRPMSVVVVDLDGLREVNNDRGHGAGDALLESVAQHWASRLRSGDLIGRIGGDEFLFVLPGTTKEAAEDIVDRLADGSPGSWSAGVAMAKPGDTMAGLLERADQRLYVHKASRSL